MKHPFFAHLGDGYPRHLEARFDRVLTKIEQLWCTPQIDDYFAELIIDKRGGRQGFPREVLEEILRLRDLRDRQTLGEVERRDTALTALARRGLALDPAAFLQAVSHGDKDAVDLFIRAGIRIHVGDREGNPPLMIALRKGYTIVAKILIEAGADVNFRDRIGLTPLLLACGKSSAGANVVAEMLIRRGAHINVRDGLGHSPLTLALAGGMLDVAEQLIERGADLAVRAAGGETPASLAQAIDSPRIAQLVLQRGTAAAA